MMVAEGTHITGNLISICKYFIATFCAWHSHWLYPSAESNQSKKVFDHLSHARPRHSRRLYPSPYPSPQLRQACRSPHAFHAPPQKVCSNIWQKIFRVIFKSYVLSFMTWLVSLLSESNLATAFDSERTFSNSYFTWEKNNTCLPYSIHSESSAFWPLKCLPLCKSGCEKPNFKAKLALKSMLQFKVYLQKMG